MGEIMNYKVMIFDIDGTLVDDDHNFSDRTKEAIKRLYDQGIILGLASGRTIGQLQQHAKEWGLEGYFKVLIALNGASLYDGINNKEYDFFRLKREWIKEIIEMMQVYKEDAKCHIYNDELTIFFKEDEDFRKYKMTGRKVIAAETIDEMCQYEVPKVLFKTTLEKSEEIESYAKAHCTENYEVVRTQPIYLEFVCRGCTKAYGLKYFCEHNNIDLKDVVSFGDTSNDNNMLEVSGLGVCLANGSEDTKKIADVVTKEDNNHDGLAKFIEENLL